jgi:septum formation protein
MNHLPLAHVAKPPDARLILASDSPQRRALLAQLGLPFEILPPPPGIERPPRQGEPPQALVACLARAKAQAVAPAAGRGVLVACDTVAECRGRILGKPLDVDDARRMLLWQRGTEQFVHSGLCVWCVPNGEPQVRLALTRLRMAPISDDQLEEYLASGMWQGKAGAFGYQDRLGWLEILEGSESNVVGLPLELLAEMLADVFKACSPDNG